VSDHAFPNQARGRKEIGRAFSGNREFEPPPEGSDAGSTIYPESWTERVLSPTHLSDPPASLPDPSAGDAAFKYPDQVAGYRKFYAIDQQLASVVLEA
jgi:hypothetical protein